MNAETYAQIRAIATRIGRQQGFLPADIEDLVGETLLLAVEHPDEPPDRLARRARDRMRPRRDPVSAEALERFRGLMRTKGDQPVSLDELVAVGIQPKVAPMILERFGYRAAKRRGLMFWVRD